jgi:hypothetical protein
LAVHFSRALPGPATFRLQGLATLLAAYSRRAPAGSVSHRQRSWDPPFGAFPSRKVSGAFPPGSTHMPFSPAGIPAARSGGPAQRTAAPGFLPFRESLATVRVLARRSLAAPLGFALPGSSSGSLARVFAQAPPARFRGDDPCGPCPSAPRSIDQLPPAPARTTRQAGAPARRTLLGFLHRHVPDRSSAPVSELWIHLIPRRALPPTAR